MSIYSKILFGWGVETLRAGPYDFFDKHDLAISDLFHSRLLVTNNT